MALQILDTLGLKCAQPIHKIEAKIQDMESGDILQVMGDCRKFEIKVRKWCERQGKVFLDAKHEGNNKTTVKIRV
jgi:TusA-related sulfurtransferase